MTSDEQEGWGCLILVVLAVLCFTAICITKIVVTGKAD